MKSKHIHFFITVILLPIFFGCATRVNQENLIRNRTDFNSVVVHSWDQQMLLNLVRMRYRDNPMFLELGNVVSTQSTKVGGGITGEIMLPGASSGSSGIGLSGEKVLTPTITYIPLQGEEFARRMLTPIPPSTILLLSQSGWSLERLMLCCVQQMNNVPNAVSASGPTPDYVPEFKSFHKLSEALRLLQIGHTIKIDLENDGTTLLISLQPSKDSNSDSAAVVFTSLLGLDHGKEKYRLTANRNPSAPDEIALTGRSLLSVMFFLSQSVEVPSQHEAEGKVTVTLYPDGTRFRWSDVTGKVMRIRSSVSEPDNAAVKVFYRETWFFIADNDLNSKTTFNLLTFLFNLQAANKRGAEPLLTYPVR